MNCGLATAIRKISGLASPTFGKQHFPAISLKPACFEMMGVNRGAATERASQVVEAFQIVVGRDDEMPILSKLSGLKSKTEYPRDRKALSKGILPHNP